MADLKISELTNLTAADPANDMIPIVDVSATPPASGSTKRISINNILACSPTATLASATITGDLTVDTSTLKVDSANNRVGIGTASPIDTLDVRGNISLSGVAASSRYVILGAETTGYTGSLTIQAGGGSSAYGGGIVLYGNSHATYPGAVWIGRSAGASGPIMFGDYGTGPGNKFLQLDTGGVCTWYDGAGGTRMTLNSIGLGVGESPVSGQKLTVNGNGSVRNGNRLYLWDTGNSTAHGIYNSGDNLTFSKNNGTTSMLLDASGNLILLSSNTPATLTTNGQLTVNATSNTNLRFSYRGSDGVTRVADITLA